MKLNPIGLEKYSNYKKMKITSLVGGILVIILGLIGIIINTYDVLFETEWIKDFTGRLLDPITLLVYGVFSFTLFVGLKLFTIGLRRVRMGIYEEGFVPYKIPKGYSLKKKKELLIPWEDVVWIEYIDSLMWIYLIATKDRWGIAIGEMRFSKKDAPKVLEFLQKVEKMVEERGGYVVHKRWNPLKGWIIEYERGRKPFKRVGHWYWPGFDEGNP